MRIEPLTAQVHGFDINAAYEVARLVHEERIREGASRVGRKIGFTNRDMWHAYGRVLIVEWIDRCDHKPQKTLGLCSSGTSIRRCGGGQPET
jgi:hypothetical protein